METKIITGELTGIKREGDCWKRFVREGKEEEEPRSRARDGILTAIKGKESCFVARVEVVMGLVGQVGLVSLMKRYEVPLPNSKIFEIEMQIFYWPVPIIYCRQY